MDDCGVCGGDNACLACSDADSDGVCDEEDECPYDADVELDCAGWCKDGSGVQPAYYDDCGVCSEGYSGRSANSDMDDCGVCGGNNSDMDDCGVCGGNNSDMDDC